MKNKFGPDLDRATLLEFHTSAELNSYQRALRTAKVFILKHFRRDNGRTKEHARDVAVYLPSSLTWGDEVRHVRGSAEREDLSVPGVGQPSEGCKQSSAACSHSAGQNRACLCSQVTKLHRVLSQVPVIAEGAPVVGA